VRSTRIEMRARLDTPRSAATRRDKRGYSA